MITLTLNDEQEVKFMELLKFMQAHPDTKITTPEQLAERVIERGLYDVNYRTRRNIREYASYKAYKQSQ